MSQSETIANYAELTSVDELTEERTIARLVEVSNTVSPDRQDPAMDELLELTNHLVEITGESAAEEYHRYNATAERCLDLPMDKLIEKHAGKKVLVTGGSGLIGSALLGKLRQLGCADLVSVSRGQTSPVQQHQEVSYRTTDVRDKAALREIMNEVKPDIVYHVAADKYNHEAEKRARHTLTTNIVGTRNVIETAAAAGVQELIYASTGKASRPFSPDVYASSKKVGEWLMSRAAKETDMTCSAARFTHVVDDSNIRKRMLEWAANGDTMRLQGPDVWFYVQSAQESAELLLNSSLEAEDDTLHIQAIRELGLPVNLAQLGVGVIHETGVKSPIHFQGAIEGYEDKAWPMLFGMEAGDYSPLLVSTETHAARPSVTCPDIDSFPLEIASNENLDNRLEDLLAACDSNYPASELRAAGQALSWEMLDARLAKVPSEVLQTVAKRIERVSSTLEFNQEHELTNASIFGALALRGNFSIENNYSSWSTEMWAPSSLSRSAKSS